MTFLSLNMPNDISSNSSQFNQLSKQIFNYNKHNVEKSTVSGRLSKKLFQLTKNYFTFSVNFHIHIVVSYIILWYTTSPKKKYSKQKLITYDNIQHLPNL